MQEVSAHSKMAASVSGIFRASSCRAERHHPSSLVSVENSAMSAETSKWVQAQVRKTAANSGASGRVTLKKLGHKHTRSH